MALEIERKFRVTSEDWRPLVSAKRQIRQAYLADTDRISLRVRIKDAEAATLTIKTAAPGLTRQEFEYSIPLADAEELLHVRTGAIVVKTRHIVPAGNLMWEIDEFAGENAGLVLAEIELEYADQPFERPAWLGEEVTYDRRFYNSELSQHPFSQWS